MSVIWAWSIRLDKKLNRCGSTSALFFLLRLTHNGSLQCFIFIWCSHVGGQNLPVTPGTYLRCTSHRCWIITCWNHQINNHVFWMSKEGTKMQAKDTKLAISNICIRYLECSWYLHIGVLRLDDVLKIGCCLGFTLVSSSWMFSRLLSQRCRGFGGIYNIRVSLNLIYCSFLAFWDGCLIFHDRTLSFLY